MTNMQLYSRAIRDNLMASSQELREPVGLFSHLGREAFVDLNSITCSRVWVINAPVGEMKTHLSLDSTSLLCSVNSLHVRPWIGLGHFQAYCHFLHSVPRNPGMQFQWREPTFQEYKVACNIQINSYSAMALSKRQPGVEPCTISALLAPRY